MNKKQQMKQQIEQLATKFGYEINQLDFTHNTIVDNNDIETGLDMVTLEMITTDFTDTPIEIAKFDTLKDMRDEFYKSIADGNINLSELPETHPLKVISTMFLIAKTGQTDEGWGMFAFLLGSVGE